MVPIVKTMLPIPQLWQHVRNHALQRVVVREPTGYVADAENYNAARDHHNDQAKRNALLGGHFGGTKLGVAEQTGRAHFYRVDQRLNQQFQKVPCRDDQGPCRHFGGTEKPAKTVRNSHSL
jgi:hypothetical protein